MFACLSLLLTLSVAQAEDRETFSHQEGNFRLTYPYTWRKINPPDEAIQLVLRRGTDIILVWATESNVSLEEIAEAVELEQKMRTETYKELSRKEIKVGGEKALTIQFEAKNAGVKATGYATVFVHQGITYRVVGVRVLGEAKQFEKDYFSILDEFSYPAERKEWLAKFEGKPGRTALLGGLASFELNRPRWTETTLDSPRDYNSLDEAKYDFFPGGAWVTVRVRETKGDAAAELEELQHSLAARLQKVKTVPTTVKVGQERIPSVEISGESGEFSYVMRAAVLVEDGLVAQVWLETVNSQREVTRRDWDQLLSGFVLQRRSKPEQPPAFPIRRSYYERHSPDPALGVFLPKATQLFAGPRRYEVLTISPDGSRALARTADGVFLENLVTHRREPLVLEGFLIGPGTWRANPVAWSRDGKQLAYTTAEEIVVLSLETKKTRKLKAAAGEIAFGPGEQEMVVCTREAELPVPGRLASNRLEVVNLDDESRRVVLDYPLCRVAHPAVSPDGKSIALVANRDYPRTAAFGGHLYVCLADGSGLRQLTKEPEEISSVVWSPDGKWLYAVRRLAVGERGAVGAGGANDIYRLSPDTGKAVNLTRSGNIGRIWSDENDLLFEVAAWDVSPSQQGIFRIGVEELEKATASRPVPPVSNPRAQAKAIADKVQAALGPTPLKNVVPTPALLEKTAKAFAEAAEDSCGCRLDFSAASLDRLYKLAFEIELSSGRDPPAIFGFGAYYGETLRKLAGAEWKIKPVPFGDWLPGQPTLPNPLAEVVLPFSASYRLALDPESDRLRTGEQVAQREQGQKLLLVYPPPFAEEALREATGPEYEKALELMDAGEVKPALEILARELKSRPKNRSLAREVIALCEAAKQPDTAADLTRQAVEAGNEVPELLIRYADSLAETNPKKALEFYRKAVQAEWAPAEAFLKLGQAYADQKQSAIAESCWRQAYSYATAAQRKQIRQLMGLPERPDGLDLP